MAREREPNKIKTPDAMWARLQPHYRAALSCMGEEIEIGIPHADAMHLQSWALIRPTRHGWLL
ncbi:MAG: hypothetical protein EBR82_69555, partial [Caulobacteraceae bacterium]|nr:hypothetical protein [Caulobacteraceae bacterium]